MNPGFRLRRRGAVGVVAMLLIVVLAWRWLTPEKRPQYLSAKVVRSDIEDVVLATGTLQAFKQVDVGAQVSGQLKSLKVMLGDKVKTGQWLAEIDPVIPRNTLRKAESNIGHLVAQKRATVAQLNDARIAYRRQQQLLADDSTSKQSYDTARAKWDVERANLAALEAQIRGAHIETETARANLGFTRIIAPMDGEVVAIVTQEGQTVIAQQQAPVILKLADLDTMTIKAQVSEADVIRISPGQTVYFTILGEPDKRYYGRLRAIEPGPHNILEMQNPAGGISSGPSRPNTAVFYNALFEVPNPDHRLRIAMTAQVSVLLDTAKRALSIPVAALGERASDGRYAVRLLSDDGRVSTRQIRTGLNNGVKVEVRDGLKDGERVVISAASDASSDT